MMPEQHEHEYHKQLPDFETFDAIRLYVVPRFKSSSLSGDEWRQHVQVDFFFKGVKVFEFACRDMKTAAMMLGGKMIESYDQGISDEALALERGGICDQPSCKEPSVGRFLIKAEFSDSGERLDPSETHGRKYRQFCKEHSTRGDSSREDSDDNYESRQPTHEKAVR